MLGLKDGMVGCLGITQVIAYCWEVLLSLSVVQPSETQKEITRELLFISRLTESSDYTTFLLTLAGEKFGSPDTTGSFSLSGASFLMTEILYFPKCYSWTAV